METDDIPEELPELLEKFTAKVIIERPHDIVEFAANYFQNLLVAERNIKMSEAQQLNITRLLNNLQTPSETTQPSLTAKPISGVPQSTSDSNISGIPLHSEKSDDSLASLPSDLFGSKTASGLMNPSGDESQKEKESDSVDYLSKLPSRTGEGIIDRRIGQIQSRRQSVVSESFNPEAHLETELTVHPKTESQWSRLQSAVKHIFIFQSLDEDQLKKIVDSLREMPISKGQTIINQGEHGDFFYVIESGTYDIYVNDKHIGSYNGSGSFGELALMYNTPRAATITARSDGILWTVDRTTFRLIVMRQAFLKRQLYESWLNSVPLLKSLSNYERTNLADALISRTYEDGEYIIKQGERGEEMYFIEDGIVEITAKDKSGQEKFLKRLEKNAYFGELALILHEPRQATAKAIGKIKLAVLHVSSFERLMGSCVEIMLREVDHYRSQLIQILGPDGISNYPALAAFATTSTTTPTNSNDNPTPTK